MANDVRARASLKDDLSGPLTRIGDVWNRQSKNFATGALAARGAEKAFSLVGQAVSGVGDFMQTAMGRASALNESMGKVNVVFGDGARDVERWADTASTAFGQSKQQALEAAGTYGNLFQAFGIGQQEAQKMSTTLVELAADLASFNNTSIDDALIALRSGLSGETEPLKRYGIAISDARMRTTLLSMGVKDLGATLTPLQKSQAAYTLILKDSTLAQGDFARTADGVANSLRTNQAAIADLEAEIGQKALPAQKAFLDIQKDLLGTASALAVGLDTETASLSESADAMQVLLGFVSPLGAKLAESEIAAIKSAAAWDEVTTAAEGTRGAIFGARDAIVQTRGPGSDMNRILAEMGYEAGEVDKAISGLSDAITDELFGDAINAGNLAQLRETHAELIKQRDAAKEGSREYKILTGDIAANEQAQFDLQLQMAQQEGSDALLAFLNRAQTKYGTNNVRIQTMIDKLRALYGLLVRYDDLGVITFGPYDGKIIPGFHSGGRPTPGEPAIVGEKGPELFVPDTAGTIVPNGGSGGTSYGGSSGSPVVIELTLDGATLARIVDRRLRYASPRSVALPD